ncbi:hypothetical protein TorRG33x02_035650 [Trema orientale]|uniref:Uncharacterized protein n=1 Tax=Trema orientale TaxID=63057 RepID=A0A2P5FRT8_TREOI|nr:hypothetical protein TorRG33x02_035650 [Trema orientale]
MKSSVLDFATGARKSNAEMQMSASITTVGPSLVPIGGLVTMYCDLRGLILGIC